MAGKGGGAWKVAYADFVTAMMAFFLVMWLVSQSEPVKEAIAHHFQDPFSLDDPTEHDDNGDQKKKSHYKPRRQKKEHEDERHPTPPERLPQLRAERTVVGAEIYFSEDSTKMDGNSNRRLNDIIPILAGKPNKIDVRGHATRKPPKAGAAYQDPWDLCYARCAAVRKYLIEQGIPPEQIRLSQAGPFEPRKESFNADEVALNARVEVYLLSEFVTDLPGEARRSTIPSFDKDETPTSHGDGHGKSKKDVAHGHGASDGHGEEKGQGGSKSHAADAHGADASHGAHGEDAHGVKPTSPKKADSHDDHEPAHVDSHQPAAGHDQSPHGSKDAAH